jgi:hypothetical protein
MKIASGLIALVLISMPANALARGHSGGHSGGSHRYGGHVYGFRTGHCKSAACYRKHPNGTYVHPLTKRKHP